VEGGCGLGIGRMMLRGPGGGVVCPPGPVGIGCWGSVDVVQELHDGRQLISGVFVGWVAC